MDVSEAIRTRRSIGKVTGEVGRETIRALIEAATWAPNHRLTQPWRFTVLAGEARAKLGEVWSACVAAGLRSTGEERERALDKERRKPLRAPVLIVASTRTDPDPVVAEEDFAATAAAVQNLLLTAAERSLGAMWRTGAMVHSPEVKAFLGLEPADRIVAIVYVGELAMTPPVAQPREIDGVTRWLDADETRR